jgi:hypothetical protein
MKLKSSEILVKAKRAGELALKLRLGAEKALQEVEAIEENASYHAEKKIKLTYEARQKHADAMLENWQEATRIGEELKAEKPFYENLAFLASQAEFGSGRSGDAVVRNQTYQELLHLPAPLVKLYLDHAHDKNDIATGYQIYRVGLQRSRQEDWRDTFTRVKILEGFTYEGRDEVLQAIGVAGAHAAAALSSWRVTNGTQKAVSVQKLIDGRAMREAEGVNMVKLMDEPTPLPGTKPIPYDAV